MPSIEIIDELDRCKTALQVVAEMQSDGVATLLDLLIENLDAGDPLHQRLRLSGRALTVHAALRAGDRRRQLAKAGLARLLSLIALLAYQRKRLRHSLK